MTNKLTMMAAAGALALTAGVANAGTISATDLGIIVDSSSSSTTIAVTAADVGTGPITSITLDVGISACGSTFTSATGPCSNNANGTFDRELYLTLTSAAGTAVDLVQIDTHSGHAGGGSFAFAFDDAAANVIGGGVLTSGTFKPVESLSALLGENPLGNWTLTIGDSVGSDPKRLDSYALTINTDRMSPVPLPAGLPLILVGLGAFGVLRSRKGA